MSKVAVIKTNSNNVLDDISRLFALAEAEGVLDKSKTTILKDNISWHLMFPGANTTPWQLEGTIKALRARDFKDIVAVHNNTVVTNPYLGGKLNKLASLYKKYNIPEKYNFLPEDIKWIKYRPIGKMLVLDKIFEDGILIPEYFVGKNIIHLPTVKCHIYTTTTGAMKNAFGGLLNTKRHYCHSAIHQTLVDLLRIQKEIHPGIFTIMDGTTCGNGPGPRTMKPEVKNYILASSDSVAIDSVAAKMMGFEPMKLDYIRLAHEEGLGTGDISQIEVVGDDIRSVNFYFSVGDNVASKVGDAMWFGPLKYLQKLFFHTPLVYLFIFGSMIFHDYIWYPLKGKMMIKKWLKNTQWGELFKRY
ncbi:DUF362 domain-containing protein [Patescibacteria group bacterium]|nr:DUF362 domain-containing protein [Patescibacteria group bacterium]